MSTVIKVENISKQYRLGDVGTGALSHDLKRWWYKARGKEDPYLQIGETNDRSSKGNSEYVWALKDINFDVKAGEVLGIIGRNGAGKSTLLKILSKTTTPTTGNIKVRGRIASLLEVGTGFHPELTGRENIFLNGAILGMTKREIQKKFDEIVDFSGVERYIDTPVKRYSSGMYVRLAFAVAAHLEPEILIVDEVLAVGDAEFQKKCLGKMKDVSVNEGRTVLFVSHNMGAVKELCTRSILLKNGMVDLMGNTNEIVRKYLLTQTVVNSSSDLINDATSRRGFGEVRFTEIVINNGDSFLDPMNALIIKASAIVKQPISGLYFSLLIKSPESGEQIATTGLIQLVDKELKSEEIIEFEASIPANTFRTGLFPTYFWLGRKGELAEDNYPYDLIDSVYYLNFSTDKSKEEMGYSSEQPGAYVNLNSQINNIQIL